MSSVFRNKFAYFILALAILGIGFYGYAENSALFAPCSRPLTYSITSVDPRFNISNADFSAALAAAENTWEQAAGRDLFAQSPNGKVAVSLVYDYRQEAIDRLKDLGLTIDSSKKSYYELKAQYDSKLAFYQTQQAQIQSLVNQYDKLRTKYEQDLKTYNNSRHRSQSDYDSLFAEQQQVNALADEINSKQAALKKTVDDVNALANLLNQLAGQLNLNVAEYNQVGQTTGSEFQEGVYTQDAQGRQITVYEFGSRDELVRVLAHELGHALGLEHVADPNAIMYKINQSANQTPTAADLAELARVCKFK